MSLIFNMLSRLVITFLPRNKHLLISWLQSPSEMILECIKKQRHDFANKHPYSQSYGFSSGRVGMWQCVWAFPQSCLTLCGPMDCSPPGSSVHRIFQARILEWVAISYSKASLQPRNWTCVSLHFLWWQADLLLVCHLWRCWWCWQVDHKEHHRSDAFELWCWRRLLRVP